MRRRDNAHSRLVAWLKIVLPLGALALLSTLFLFSHSIDPSRAVRFSKVDVKQIASEQQVTMPNYNGVTQDGTSVSVTASVAKPLADPAGGGTGGTAQAAGKTAPAAPAVPAKPGARATVVHATFDHPDGGYTKVDAQHGKVNPTTGNMDLSGGVVITTSDGYRMDTDALTGRLDRTHLQSAGAVAGTGPLGRIDADHMVIDATPGADGKPGPYVLVFNGDVKLVYTPSQKGK
ncbi:LPS export ABC transporter periplasmic protein LptC [Acidimangrovimonas sediminis]|uniref:LPS export ABC transporter periplasmic protein LptC n=1 Tax=Acidimangrovimonas sediminis TaxID=2056283 RepID=UPI000C7FCAA4|nr:LPS export ABC transporter periplasmic protein LptC [Acidimangrovimonas sediminis]